MEEDIGKELECVNNNLVAIAKNQAVIYEELKEIEKQLQEPQEKTG